MHLKVESGNLLKFSHSWPVVAFCKNEDFNIIQYMKVGRQPEDGDITINGHTLNQTTTFTYLAHSERRPQIFIPKRK